MDKGNSNTVSTSPSSISLYYIYSALTDGQRNQMNKLNTARAPNIKADPLNLKRSCTMQKTIVLTIAAVLLLSCNLMLVALFVHESHCHRLRNSGI